MAAPVGPVKFWRPGTEGPDVSISEERQSVAENSGTTIIYNPYAALSIEQQRQKLPVFKLRNHILYLIENYQTVVIVGETGCGKSTQIPQYLAEAGWTAEGRVVGVTQPRRVAAVTKFRDFFNQNETSDPARDTCVILTVEGRTFPVDIFYLQSPVPDYIKATVDTVVKIHQTEGDGDILAFLTGQEEVETVVSMLIEQARVLARTGMKKHLRV
uniref:DEAH-box helicase 35 n=1 Tax=Nannospalax galili TaxID=1026970 RepID=A0A8C6RH75_NANGA